MKNVAIWVCAFSAFALAHGQVALPPVLLERTVEVGVGYPFFGNPDHLEESSHSSPSLTLVNDLGDRANAEVSFSGGTAPFMAAQIHLDAGPHANSWTRGVAGGVLRYSLSISGPAAIVPVAVSAKGFISVHVDPFMASTSPPFSYVDAFSAYAGLSIDGPGLWISRTTEINYSPHVLSGVFYSPNVVQTTPSRFEGGFTVAETHFLQTGVIYNVVMAASAHGGATHPNESTHVFAMVDPTFTIDLPTTQASSYSITYSDGLIPHSSIPDSGGTATLLLSSMSAAFAFRWLSRKKYDANGGRFAESHGRLRGM